jgi:hypothetical protein
MENLARGPIPKLSAQVCAAAAFRFEDATWAVCSGSAVVENREVARG